MDYIRQYLLYFFREPVREDRPTLEGYARAAGFEDARQMLAELTAAGLLEVPRGARVLGHHTAAQLRGFLREHGLKVSGRKADLVARLAAHVDADSLAPPDNARYRVATARGQDLGHAWKAAHDAARAEMVARVEELFGQGAYREAIRAYKEFARTHAHAPWYRDEDSGSWVDPNDFDPATEAAAWYASNEAILAAFDRAPRLFDWSPEQTRARLKAWFLHGLGVRRCAKADVPALRRINTEWVLALRRGGAGQPGTQSGRE